MSEKNSNHLWLLVGLSNVSELVSLSLLLISSTSSFLRVLPLPYLFNWNTSGFAIVLQTKLREGLPCRPSWCGPACSSFISPLWHTLSWNQNTNYSPFYAFLIFACLLAFPKPDLWLERTHTYLLCLFTCEVFKLFISGLA